MVGIRIQAVLQLFSILMVYTVVLVAGFVFAAWFFSTFFTWTGNEWLYIVTRPLQDNPILSLAIIWLIGAVVVVVAYIWVLAGYVQKMTDACDQIVRRDAEPVHLPSILAMAEVRLNELKTENERSLQAAQEAEQRKNDLVVYLAHDLKTPLTSIIGYLSLLHDEEHLPEELRQKYTDVALQKSLRLEELINEFFDITRFNLTTPILEKETVSLSRMLEQIQSEFEPLLLEKQLHWNVNLESGVEIYCDPDKMQRVFDNLIRNAIAYSYPDSEIELDLKCVGARALVSLTNHGKTIPPEKLERIFEQFFRVDSARFSESGGAGLGLAIAKQLVELHGGTITAQSEQERVRFLVSLPLGAAS